MPQTPNEPSKDERIRRVVMDFRQTIASGQPYDRESFVCRDLELAEELRTILKAIELTEPFLGTGSSNSTAYPSASTRDAPQPNLPNEGGTVDWRTEAKRDSSISDITRTHIGGSGSSHSAPPIAKDWSPAMGSMVGKYRLIRQLGRGGMGEVFEAEEEHTGRRFALKMLSANMPRSKETIDRFLNEASLAASLSHPRTTFVYDAAREGNHFFITMELMPGHTLKDLVEREGPRPVGEAIDAILDILDGLEAAHHLGVVHRDLKPSNCFIDASGRVKVGDFGLAKSLLASADLTQTGTFLGTPQFAAPEQIRRGPVDRRTDLFSVGATLYYLLSGEPPFKGDPAAVIAQIVSDTPPNIRVSRPNVPKTLARILSRSMAKSPKKRYRSAAEMRKALMPFATEGVSVSNIGRRMAAFVLDLVVVAVATMLAYIIHGCALVAMTLGESPIVFKPVFGFMANMSLLAVLYFAISESIWGCSLGKRWLGIHVVNTYGEAPGFWRGLIRACIYPGLFLTTLDVTQSILSDWQQFRDFAEMMFPQPVVRRFVLSEGFTFLKALSAVLCFATMRRANGYLGLHEILSGTRVVRTREDHHKQLFRRLADHWGRSQIVEGLPVTIGPYRVVGAYGGTSQVQVLDAMDDKLSRPIWLYRSAHDHDTGDEASPADRSTVNRTTRQRWLQRGIDETGAWQAVEAIDGGPVMAAVTEDRAIPWEIGRRLLPDLADELIAAINDGTLPTELTFDQLWLDRDGGLKLIDFPLWQKNRFGEDAPATSTGTAGEVAANESPDLPRAWRFFQDVSRACQLDLETPGEALEYLADLSNKPMSSDALRSAAKRLRKYAEVPYQLGWDNRLGILALSLAVDLPLLLAWNFLGLWWITGVVFHHIGWSIFIGTLYTAILPFILGFASHGGLAFVLSDFQSRVLKSRKLNRLRSALRNVLAWAPVVVSATILRTLTFVLSAPEVVPARSRSDSFFVGFFAAIPMVILVVVAAAGAIYALMASRRGVQDVLVGTYVVHK